MDEKPRPVPDLDDDETAGSAEGSGPLGSLIDRETASATVESDITRKGNRPGQPDTASTEYAAGTTEHEDDREPLEGDLTPSRS
jgi:hypothetical protein